MATPATPTQNPPRQTRADREFILNNLPDGTKRVQVLTSQGAIKYVAPADVDLNHDEIPLVGGLPVTMKGQPGRRAKTVLPPATPAIAEVVAARDDHVDNDGILKEVRKSPEGTPLMDLVLAGMADEAAVLEFERKEIERNGGDTTNISIKRARVLKSIADTWLKRKSVTDGGLIDLDGPPFQALFSMIIDAFREAMQSAGAREELIAVTFTNLLKTVKEPTWRGDAKSKMRENLT